jgi:hypothetical protein
MIAHRRQSNPFILPLIVLGLIGMLLAGGGSIRTNGMHNVHYNYTDGNGLHPCNDNGNNWWLNMVIEWAEGKYMHTGYVDCAAVFTAQHVDAEIDKELAVRKIVNPTTSQYNEVMQYVLRMLAKPFIH